MVVSENLLIHLERALQKRFRFAIAALGLMQNAQPANGRGERNMLLTVALSGQGDELFGKRNCLGVFSIVVKLIDLGIQGLKVIINLCLHGRAGGYRQRRYQQNMCEDAREAHPKHFGPCNGIGALRHCALSLLQGQ